LVVSRDYIQYLKRTVDWEVQEYEDNIFKGMTVDDVKTLLGWVPDNEDVYPQIEEVPTPAQLDWSGAKCDVGPQNQGKCGSCWAFAAAGSLAARCCLHATDHGWLSPQELVSCDKSGHGCNGGTLAGPVSYEQKNGGLVPEACYPYLAKDAPCPTKCKNGGDWKAAHVCKCASPKTCSGTNGIKSCLTYGPVTIGFMVCQSFMNYKSGIYKCDCTNYLGGHAVLVMGQSDSPQCHYTVRNSWGTSWGEGGYFRIQCTTCQLQGGAVCGAVSN
jgi:cathepsin L